jgi:RNA polymerase sigma-70 factor, ECF subfamily
MENEEIFRLLDRIEKREEQALRALHLVFGRRIYAFALTRLQDSMEAEEVLADTMYEIWKHPSRFRGESSFSTWLLGIARHKILNVLRARSPAHAELDDEAHQVVSEEPDGFAVLAEKQKRRILLDCMSELPDEQRECLHLVLFEELPLAEIARLQNCPLNTVKTRLFHAREKMKACVSRCVMEN